MDMRAVEDPIFCFVQQHNATNIFNTIPRFIIIIIIMKQDDLRLCLFQSYTVSLGMYWTEYEWLMHSHRQIIDLGHQVLQVYKIYLCSIFMTDLMSQAWTIRGMYTTINTTACLPPAQRYWAQINPGPHSGMWMLHVPSAVHPLSWEGADGW